MSLANINRISVAVKAYGEGEASRESDTPLHSKFLLQQV